MAGALFANQPLEKAPLVGVRENLDMIPAGPRTAEVRAVLEARRQKDASKNRSLELALSKLAHEYDWIIIDTPPTDQTLQELALAVAHFVVIPTKSDLGSMRGIGRLGEQSRLFGNPDLTLLGIVLFDVDASAKKLRSEIQSELAEWMGDTAPVFEGVIRHAQKAATDMRRLGVVAVEYKEQAASPKKFGMGRKETFASNAATLSRDYKLVATEIMNAFTAKQGGAE